MDSAIAIAQKLHAAFEAGQSGDALRPLFIEDCRVVERPNPINPKGGTATLEEMLAASKAGTSRSSSRRDGRIAGIETYDCYEPFAR